MIIGEIQRFLRDDGSVKVSRSLKETGNKIRKMRDELSKEFGRAPTINEVAEALELTPEEVVLAQEARVVLLHRYMKPCMKMMVTLLLF